MSVTMVVSLELFPDSEIIPELTYSEAREFSELGAKIINSKSITPAQNENIPIYVVDENGKGTKISSHVSLEHMGAKIIASVPNQSVFFVPVFELPKVCLAF